MTEDRTPEPPTLRVVRGDPTAEELAGLLTLLGARATTAGAATDEARRRTAWNDPARLVRGPVAAGPGGWRRSTLPA